MFRKPGVAVALSGVLLLGLWLAIHATARTADSVVGAMAIGSSLPILTGLGDVGATVLVDLDRDGQLDLAYSEGDALRIARNTVGLGVEWGTTWGVGTASDTVTALASGDVDQDGRPDLVSVAGDEILVWLNPATPQSPGETFAGTWTVETTLSVPGGVSRSALALADLDRDGGLDVATGGVDGVVHLWQNPNGGTWSVRHTLAPLAGPIRDLAVDDLDDDSRPDLIVVSGGVTSIVRLWRNPGAAFSGSWNTSQDLTAAPGLEVQEGTLCVADLNGDHRPDVVVGDAAGAIYVWERPATNPFGQTWAGQQIVDTQDSIGRLLAVDLGRDAGAELVVVAGDTPVRLETWKRAQCSGGWEMTQSDQSDSDLLSLGAGDLDRDGDMDIVAASPDEVLAWENAFAPSPLRFDSTGQSVGATGEMVVDVMCADLDNDGDMDLVSGDALGRIMAWRNDGSPFGSGWVSFLIGDRLRVSALAAGDMDDDGDVDIVVGHRPNNGVAIWENNGGLTGWTRWVIGWGGTSVGALAVGDIDGDGSLDVVGGSGDHSLDAPPTSDNRVTVWLNRPLNQTWPAVDVGEAYYAVRSVALGDLDIDGDTDIVIGTNRAPAEGSEENPVPREEWPDVYQIRAFRNDGVTSWFEIDVGRDPEFETLGVQYHGFWGTSISSVAVADLDNDGDLDIVSTDHMEGDFQVMGWENDGTPFSGPETLWRGSAISVGPFHNWLFSSVLSSAPGDFDGDGDIDVATANAYARNGQAEVIVWENTGIAFHEVVSQTHWARHDIGEFEERVNAIAVRAADLDLDGNLDLASAGYTDSTPYAMTAWQNTTNRPPDPPACPSPPLWAVEVPVTTTLAWGGSDPDGDLLTYTVALGTHDRPAVISTSVTTEVYTPAPLQGHTTYFWQITATDEIRATGGPIWRFTTANRRPNVPHTPVPPDGATDWSPYPTLTWQADDPDGDEVTYTVALGISDPPPVLSASVTGMAYSVAGPLQPDTVYYWYITATDGVDTAVGPVWQFTTSPDLYHFLPLVIK